MIDSNAVLLALRARALTVVAATTGSATLSATASGYARTAGSFLTDGFAAGMELLAAGYTAPGANGIRVITGVSALTITTATAPTVEAAAAGRTLSVGLPALRAWDNVALTPIAGRPYIDEDFVPATHELLSFPAQGGTSEERGLYVLTLYGLENTGSNAIRKTLDALRALFAPGTALTAGSNTVRVRGDTSTQTGQIIPQGNGWAACQLTIPWRAYSNNLVAA